MAIPKRKTKKPPPNRAAAAQRRGRRAIAGIACGRNHERAGLPLRHGCKTVSRSGLAHRLQAASSPARQIPFTENGITVNECGTCARGYALRRKSEARTRARNCSAVSGNASVGSVVGTAFGFPTAEAAAFAAFFTV